MPIPEKADLLSDSLSAGHLATTRPTGAQRHTKLQAVGKTFAALCSACWDSGVACVSVASLIFSICGLLVKLTDNRVPVFQIVATRSLVSFSMCALAARLAHPPISPLFGHRAQLHLLLGRGLCGAAAMTTSYLAISALPLADAITLFFFNPATTAVAAYFLLAEPLGLKGLGGVSISLAGLVLLTQPPFIFGGDPWDATRMWGTVYGLASAFLATGAFIFIRLIGIKEEAVVLSVYFNSASFLTSSIPLAVGYPAHAVLPGGVDTALLLGISVGSFAAQVLIGRGFQLMHAAKASAVNFSQVIYSYLLGMLFLNEQLSLLGGAGSALVAAGVVLVNMRPRAVKALPPLPTTAAGSTEATMLLPDAAAASGLLHSSSGSSKIGQIELSEGVTVTVRLSQDLDPAGEEGQRGLTGMGGSSEEKDWTGSLSMGLAHTLSMIGGDRTGGEDRQTAAAVESPGVASRAVLQTNASLHSMQPRATSTANLSPAGLFPRAVSAATSQSADDLSARTIPRNLSSIPMRVASFSDRGSGANDCHSNQGKESDALLGREGVRSDAVDVGQTWGPGAQLQIGLIKGDVGLESRDVGTKDSFVEISIQTSEDDSDRQVEMRRLLG